MGDKFLFSSVLDATVNLACIYLVICLLRVCESRVSKLPVHLPRNPTISVYPDLLRDQVFIVGETFQDKDGRQVFFRGVNLGGCSKSPAGVHTADVKYLEAPVSFIDRPFSLSDAQVHFARLRYMGLTFVRLLVPWEAIEHKAPGSYDENYLAFLKCLVKLAGTFGISVIIDAHQDAWSRWTGGDGAPRWTLELCGLNVEKLFACKSSVTHAESVKDAKQYHPMSWICNYLLFAAPTMFTLFFAGKRFAPNLVIDGCMRASVRPHEPDGPVREHVQDFLQRHFFAAYKKVAEVLKDERNVLGFETLNEPHAGFITPAGSRFDRFPGKIAVGYKMTPWEATQTANGKAVKAEVWKGLLRFSHHEIVNEGKVSIWHSECVWKQHGLWRKGEDDSFQLMKPHYFNLEKGEDFQSLFLVPFWREFAKAVRDQIPDAMVFTSPAVDLSNPQIHSTELSERIEGGRQVWSPHWYDGLTLMTRTFRSYVGYSLSSKIPIRFFRNFVFHGFVADIVAHKAGGRPVGPTMLGEIGVPWLGSAERTDKALDFSLAAAEVALIDAMAIWNYSPESSWDFGDGWNREDFSIVTGDLLRTPSAVRPYPRRLAGRLKSFRFFFEKTRMEMEFESMEAIETNESEIYIPAVHFSNLLVLESSGGTWKWEPEYQTFRFFHSTQRRLHRLVLVNS